MEDEENSLLDVENMEDLRIVKIVVNENDSHILQCTVLLFVTLLIVLFPILFFSLKDAYLEIQQQQQHQHIVIPTQPQIHKEQTLTVDNTRISYNLCPIEPHSNYIPYLKFKSKDNSKDMRLYFLETMYDDHEGFFVFIVAAWYDDYNIPSQHQDYYHNYNANFKDEIEHLHNELYCWNSVGESVTPVSSILVRRVAYFEFRCPFLGFPNMLPRSGIISMRVLRNYQKLVLKSTVTEEMILKEESHSTPIHICPINRKIIGFSWVSNGVKGQNLESSILDFVFYHHYLGMDKFLIFDDNYNDNDPTLSTTYTALEPLIRNGLVEYQRCPRFFVNAAQGFLQDILMVVGKFRYYYSTSYIGFFDWDEYLVLSQEHWDETFQFYGKSNSAISPIQFLDDSVQQEKRPEPPILVQLYHMIQNLPSNHNRFLAAITVHECLAILERLDENVTSQSSMTERFPTCNEFQYHESKWIYNVRGRCLPTNHEPDCQGLTTYDQKDRHPLFILHYYNGIQKRRNFHEHQHQKLKTKSIREIIKLSQKILYNL